MDVVGPGTGGTPGMAEGLRVDMILPLGEIPNSHSFVPDGM